MTTNAIVLACILVGPDINHFAVFATLVEVDMEGLASLSGLWPLLSHSYHHLTVPVTTDYEDDGRPSSESISPSSHLQVDRLCDAYPRILVMFVDRYTPGRASSFIEL